MKPKFTDSARYPNGYKPAVKTNIRLTFKRINDELRAKEAQNKANEAEAQRVVAPILPRIKGKVA